MRIGEALFAGSMAALAGPVAPELPDDVDHQPSGILSGRGCAGKMVFRHWLAGRAAQSGAAGRCGDAVGGLWH